MIGCSEQQWPKYGLYGLNITLENNTEQFGSLNLLSTLKQFTDCIVVAVHLCVMLYVCF